MSLSFKVRKTPNYAVKDVKSFKMPNLKVAAPKVKALKIPKVAKLAILKAKVAKHVRI